MKPENLVFIFLLSLVMVAGGCASDEGRERLTASEHGEENSPAKEPKGPHGGKLFEKDGFALEVTIYEPEIPPQSHVYVYKDRRPLDPSLVTLVTELHRIDRVDTLHYKKQDDFLMGDKVVEEPHSFDVKLNATYEGKNYFWEYSSYEGRTSISDESVASSGIEIEKVGGAKISTTATLNGEVVPDKVRVVALTARFPGVVKELRKSAGSKVDKGEVVATIEANESLRTYDIVAPRSGEVLDLSAAVGELVGNSSPIMTIGDLSTVWVNLTVPRNDFSKLKVGQKVLVDSISNGEQKAAEGKIFYLSPLADGDTQTRLARAEVANPAHSLIPGLFVEAKIVIDEREVPAAIKAEALHKFRDWDVVFKKVNQNFEIAILELGETDGDFIEVKEGIAPGTDYVTKNSFVVKADVMKSGATHDH